MSARAPEINPPPPAQVPSLQAADANGEGQWPTLAEFGGVFLAINLVICDDIVSLVEMSCTICTFVTMWCTTCRFWEFAGQRAIAWQGLGRLRAALQPAKVPLATQKFRSSRCAR